MHMRTKKCFFDKTYEFNFDDVSSLEHINYALTMSDIFKCVTEPIVTEPNLDTLSWFYIISHYSFARFCNPWVVVERT